jgi:hypothetical protein
MSTETKAAIITYAPRVTQPWQTMVPRLNELPPLPSDTSALWPQHTHRRRRSDSLSAGETALSVKSVEYELVCIDNESEGANGKRDIFLALFVQRGLFLVHPALFGMLLGLAILGKEIGISFP